MSAHWKQRPEGGGRFALSLIRGIARWCGRAPARLLLLPITLYFLLVRGPERRASRASTMRPISCTTSSGVLRRLARLWAWLADSGTIIRSAPPSMARSAPLKLGTSTEADRPGRVRA